MNNGEQFFNTSAAAGGYEIERSVRLNAADSAFFSRTPASAGNRKTWTWSGWVKRSSLGSFQAIFGNGDSSNLNGAWLYFRNDDGLAFEDFASANPPVTAKRSTQVFRDPSAWYHIVLVYDTTNLTAADRIQLYVNGSRITIFSYSIDPSQNYDGYINNTNTHSLGKTGNYNALYFPGYLADVHFIDGQALDPTDFGEFDATTGVWNPKAYTGSYGTNGFHLDFADNSSAAALGYDAAGSNDWTVNNISVNNTTITYSNYLTSNLSITNAAFAFNGSLLNAAGTVSTNDGYLLFTPPSPISYSSSVRFYAYAANGYGITNYYSLNGGSEVTFVGGAPNFNGAAWITAATGSGSLTSLKVRLTRSSSQSSPGLYAIEVDGVILVNLSASDNDSLVDTPTNYGTDTGAGGEVRGNHCTWSPLDISNSSYISLRNGNLDSHGLLAGSSWGTARSTAAVNSGKWFAEITISTLGDGVILGITATSSDISGANKQPGNFVNSYGYYFLNGNILGPSNASAAYGASFTTGDVIGIALDLDAGTLVFYKNGVSQGTAKSGLSGTFAFSVGMLGTTSVASANFGQRPFAYSAPSGFKALCTTNLPAPTIENGSDYFDTVLYTGNNSTQTISGLGFSTDLVWIKARSQAYNNILFDSVRGVGKYLATSTTGAENYAGDLGWTNSGPSGNGFLVEYGTNPTINENGTSYVAWAWDAGSSTVTNNDGTISSQVRANPSAGFSIVKWTAGSSIYTVGHGLGVKPAMIIHKCTSTSEAWLVRHVSIGDSGWLVLNSTAAASTLSYGGTNTSTVFYNQDAVSTTSGREMIAYCFAPVEGYSAFGSYTGNGSVDGPFVYTGFRPAFVMLKTSSVSGNDWFIYDNRREAEYNPSTKPLYPNASYAEQGDSRPFDLLSNGFKVRNNLYINASSATVIFAAFAENPFALARAR